MSVWFVYVDYTDDGRPFYVGKGNASRVKEKERNSDWKTIALEHGWHREVVYSTRDEDDAYVAEKLLVAYHDTFRGWGANGNAGGRGQKSGWKHTKEARQKISQNGRGLKRSPVTGERIRLALTGRKTGKPAWNNGIPGRPPPNKGVPMSEEAKQHLSRLNKGKPPTRVYTPPSEESRRKMSEAHKGQPAWNKKFTAEIVEAMFSDRQSGMAVKDVAEKYGTSAPTVCRLFKERRKKTDA